MKGKRKSPQLFATKSKKQRAEVGVR